MNFEDWVSLSFSGFGGANNAFEGSGSLSPSLKLLIKQSEATEAGPFYAPCWDQKRLFGKAVGLANHIRDPRAGGLPSAWC